MAHQADGGKGAVSVGAASKTMHAPLLDVAAPPPTCYATLRRLVNNPGSGQKDVLEAENGPKALRAQAESAAWRPRKRWTQPGGER